MQIRRGMKSSLDSRQNLQLRKIQRWRALIVRARAQVEILGEIGRIRELFLVFSAILGFTTLLFLVFIIPAENEKLRPFRMMWACVSGVYFIRLCLKIHTSEKITNEVQFLFKNEFKDCKKPAFIY
jgi:hypothetical protein